MSSRRRIWLARIGLVVLLLILALGGLVARSASQRAEHQHLRELEVGRAPVVAPKRFASSLPALPPSMACVRGVVLDHGAPVSGMQISLSDSPFTVSADCPCARPVAFCGCREGLALLPQLPRAGLIEGVKSALTDATGRFELCGLEGAGTRLIWGEHLDGRLAMPRLEQGLVTRPGAFVELQVLAPIRVRGLVTSAQQPVPGATVLAFTTPPVFMRSFTADARGQFEATLPFQTSNFVVTANGFSSQRIDQSPSPQQVLVLELRAQSELTVRALSDGKPVAGAEVKRAAELPVLTDAQGVARFPLAVGTHLQVQVTKGELIGSSVINVLEGQPRRIDITLTKGVRVRGFIKDEEGQPRVGRVRGFGQGKPTLTDDRGAFTSELLEPSIDIHPTASVEGCDDSEYKELQLSESELEIVLKVACTESANGVVLDAEGNPIEGAAVFLDGVGANESATTDATGTFRFHQPAGIYQLKVLHDRYRSSEQPLQLPAKDVTIVLDAGGSITGRVVDGKGAGLAGISVTVVPAVLDALLGEVEGGNTSATTDAEGNFSVTGLLAGRLVVSATGDSLGTAVSDAVLLQPGEQRKGLVLTLDERVDLSGTVMDTQRRPIPGARVAWDPADEKSALLGVLMDAVSGRVDQVMRFMPSPSITDAEGRFTLRGLPVSKVKLTVTANGFASLEQQASKGDALNLVLEKEGGRARGRVVDEASHPLARFAVSGTVFTPDDGRFEVEVFGNTDTLAVTAKGFTQQLVPVALNGSPVKDVGDVVMKRGRQLRVEVRAEGKPLGQVRVAAAQSVDGATCTSGAEGTCVLEPLLDVETTIKAVKDDFTPVSVTLLPGRLDQVLTLELKPAGGRIIGVASAAPGQPAAARSVFISGAVSKGVMTQSDGKFSASGLPEGDYCVSLESRTMRGLEWVVTTRSSATPEALELGPVAQGGVVKGARTLPGRLVMVRGTLGPMSIARVLEASAVSLCEASSAAVITTITTGTFRVEGVPPGRWSVFHVSISQVEDKGEVQPVTIELSAGETKTLP